MKCLQIVNIRKKQRPVHDKFEIYFSTSNTLETKKLFFQLTI